jgi:hypothetical protein
MNNSFYAKNLFYADKSMSTKKYLFKCIQNSLNGFCPKVSAIKPLFHLKITKRKYNVT